jgi:hypothetical protein
VKKWLLSVLLYIFMPLSCLSQVSDAETTLMRRLDSVQHTNSVAKHFAGIYFETTRNAIDFFQEADAPVKNFIQRLETRFADYFFQSAEGHKQKDVSDNWSVYYADTSRSYLQFVLLGANAHINGDIWKSLTTEFTLEELKKYKQHYLNYQKGIKDIYLSIYADAITINSRIRLLHQLSFGLDKLYGKLMLARWRKRQMKLAILYFTDHNKFDKKLRNLNSKMDHLNHLILRHL